MYRFPNNIGAGCVILSGGWSSRMGEPKALLGYDDQSNFLQHIVGQYKEAGVNRIVVVANYAIAMQLVGLAEGVDIVINDRPELGRLHSVRLGLERLGNLGYCYLQNIDNPFTDVSLITKLAMHCNDGEYVSPEWNGKGGHPILISKPVIDALETETDRTLTFRDVLGRFPRRRVAADDDRCLVNINDPAEYGRYFRPDKPICN